MRRYSSGDWYTLVTNDGMAMLPNSVAPELVESVWLALAAGRGLAAVLEGIVGGFGTSLSALPPFAVASRAPGGEEVQVAVRGPLEVRVLAADGEVVVAGLGVTTWNERAVVQVESVEAGIPGASAPVLPINDGVVLAGRIAFRFATPSVALPLLEPLARPASARLEAPSAGAEAHGESDDSVDRVPSESEEVSPEAEVLGEIELAGEGSEDAFTGEVDSAADDGDLSHSGETTIAPLAEGIFGTGVAANVEDAGSDDYDQLLFGDTVRKSVEGAAVRAPQEAPAEAAAAPPALIAGLPQFPPAAPTAAAAQPELGDHDGETISIAKLRAMQARAQPSSEPTAFVGVAAPLPNAPATLLVSTGERFALDRGAVVGRRPRLVRVQAGNVPHLVMVPSPSQDISRSHVEIRVVGQDVVAVDLDTTNGTRLLRPGFDPIRLQPGDPTILVAGDRLDLGDGVGLGFEGLR